MRTVNQSMMADIVMPVLEGLPLLLGTIYFPTAPFSIRRIFQPQELF